MATSGSSAYGTPNPSQTPAGVTNTTYRINNDYLYPRYVEPPMLKGTFNSNSWFTGAFGLNGLVRGWLYPCDIDPDLVKAGQSTAAGTAGAQSGAYATVVAARMALEQGEVDTGAALAENAADRPAALDAVGLGAPLQTGASWVKPKKIRYSQGKQFQFNPFSVSLTIDFSHASAPAESLQENGTASEAQVGMAQTGIEMFFDRSMEVAAATSGIKKVDGFTIDPIFADVGVQKDLWDVYRVILGGDQDYFAKIGSQLINIDTVFGMKVQPGSVTDMTGRLFDLGLSGSSAFGRGVAVYYNPNMVIIGWVNSMAFTYAEFNANYIPTKAKMDMGLQVLYSTSESGGDAFVDPATDTTDPTDPDSTNPETPDSSTNNNDYAHRSDHTDRTTVTTRNGTVINV